MTPTLTPPIATKHPKRIEAQGDVRIDDYFWLRERENPDVRAYVEAENAYMTAQMAHTEGLQATLFQELRGRIQERDASVPEQIDSYFYYQRYEEGKQYPIYCRKQGSLEGLEEILLDQNELAAYLLHLRLERDPIWRTEMTRRIDDRSLGQWMPLADWKKELNTAE